MTSEPVLRVILNESLQASLLCGHFQLRWRTAELEVAKLGRGRRFSQTSISLLHRYLTPRLTWPAAGGSRWQTHSVRLHPNGRRFNLAFARDD